MPQRTFVKGHEIQMKCAKPGKTWILERNRQYEVSFLPTYTTHYTVKPQNLHTLNLRMYPANLRLVL